MSRLFCLTLITCLVAASAQADSLELDERVVAHIREIHAGHPGRRDDAFAKMGGSSVASKAFLHCFSTPHVDLGNHADLASTLDYFNADPRRSFRRQSEAAGVSWNLKYVLGGRPANFREELRATEARWALVLFGANDAQNENERVYLERLVYLVEALEEMGAVPVLGSALPRRGRSKERWIRRFNAITEAVAEHWSLPFIDYHAALSALPKKGLAADGVHPNVLPPGGLRAACQLTDEGLRYGNNVRNLFTLEMLDALRRAVATPIASPRTDAPTHAATVPEATPSTETAPVSTIPAPPLVAHAATPLPSPAGGSPGTPTSLVVDEADLPWSMLLHKPSLPALSSLPPRCGAPDADDARFARVQVRLDEPARVRVSAFDLDGERPRVYWVQTDEEGAERCVRRREQTLEVEAGAGMWDLIVEVTGRDAKDGRVLLLIAEEPR